MGTHLLLGLLAANGFVRRGEELFHAHWEHNLLQATVTTEPRLYEITSRYVHEKHEPASAYIVHSEQLQRIVGTTDPAVWRTALQELFGNAKFIHITRDLADSVVSVAFARHQNWFKSADEPRTLTIPEYDFEVLHEWYRKYVGEWVWDPQLLASLNALELTYEQLTSDVNGTMDLVERHLSVRLPVRTQWVYHKQADPNKDIYADRFREELARSGRE